MRDIHWGNLCFLISVHLIAAYSVFHLIGGDHLLANLVLCGVWFILGNWSISAGYHRLFSHPAYKSNGFVRFLFLLFGAGSVQNSALKWSADHRVHHAKTDLEADPYNAQRGFFWSHVGWVVSKDERESDLNAHFKRWVPDLLRDPIVRFQHRHYALLAIFACVVLPGVIGMAWSDPLGAILAAGFLRLTIQWHVTFFVNSLAHITGSQKYSTKNSARDSWVIAFATFGEGYHNFHHKFPNDYRNGHRWFHFDPSKWLVWGLSRVGFTWDLRRTSPDRIRKAISETLEKRKAKKAAAAG